MTDDRTSPETETLADEFTKWVEQYALKVCPEGCLPTVGQEREINLFARVAIALRAKAQTSPVSGPDIEERLWTLVRHGRDQGMKMNDVEDAAREIQRLRADKARTSPVSGPVKLLPENADERRMFNDAANLHESPLLAIAAALYVQRGIVSVPGASFYEQSTIQYNELVKADAELKRLCGYAQTPGLATRPEIQSGMDRQKWAENLILQLPIEHNGRNSWLLNYGRGEFAETLRKDRQLLFNEQSQAVNPPASPDTSTDRDGA